MTLLSHIPEIFIPSIGGGNILIINCFNRVYGRFVLIRYALFYLFSNCKRLIDYYDFFHKKTPCALTRIIHPVEQSAFYSNTISCEIKGKLKMELDVASARLPLCLSGVLIYTIIPGIIL